MIIPDYSIISPDPDALAASQCRLIIKVSRHFLHYIISHNNTVTALKYYHFTPTSGKEIAEWLEELLAGDELLKKAWKEVDIIYAIPENQLIPSVLFDHSNVSDLLAIVTGDVKKETVLTGNPGGADIYSIFQVPVEMHRFFQNNFTAARFVHYYDRWMKEEKQDGIQAIFYPNELLVRVIKEDQLQLIQNYTYQTPEDAAYYLLALYAQYDFSPDEIPLQVSGMIVRESAIYNELLKYFRTIEMPDMPVSLTLVPGFEEYPSHFFSPILKLASCEL